jgi:Tfp pilus assembly protein PilN
MKRSHIDFAPASPTRTLARTHWTSVTAATVGILLLAATLAQVSVLVDELSALESKHTQLAQRLDQQRASTVKPMAVIAKPQAEAINRVIGKWNVPWPSLLNALEAATPATVALLSIEPDPKKQRLRGTAEAKNTSDMLDYLRRLKAQPLLHQVGLVRHEINEQDPNRPVRFQFEAQWKHD